MFKISTIFIFVAPLMEQILKSFLFAVYPICPRVAMKMSPGRGDRFDRVRWQTKVCPSLMTLRQVQACHQRPERTVPRQVNTCHLLPAGMLQRQAKACRPHHHLVRLPPQRRPSWTLFCLPLQDGKYPASPSGWDPLIQSLAQ